MVGVPFGTSVVVACENDCKTGGTTLALIGCICPSQIVAPATGAMVIIGVCLTNPVSVVATVQPNASVDVKMNVLLPAGKLVTVKLPVLLLGPVDAFCVIVPGPVSVCVKLPGAPLPAVAVSVADPGVHTVVTVAADAV